MMNAVEVLTKLGIEERQNQKLKMTIERNRVASRFGSKYQMSRLLINLPIKAIEEVQTQ